MARELTREEKRAIHKLVKSLCANYDKDYGCLPLVIPIWALYAYAVEQKFLPIKVYSR